MRTWSTAPTAQMCGRCGASVAHGDRVQLVTLPNVKRIGLRCERCADPETEPAPEVPSPPPVRLDLETLGTVAADWSARKMGEAE